MSVAPQKISPADRTVGQLIAESIRLYGDNFWRGLLIALPATAFTVGASFLDGAVKIVYGVVVGPLALGLSFLWAAVVATGGRSAPGRALLAGAIAFLPLAASRVAVFTGVYFVALAWFALVALSVPTVLVEDRPLLSALRRGIQLARADFVHAFGTVAALAILAIVSIFSLSLLLAGFGAQSIAISAVLAVVVLSPVFFLGSALLYLDQEARLAERYSAEARDEAAKPTESSEVR
jgi:hypothetical protein